MSIPLPTPPITKRVKSESITSVELKAFMNKHGLSNQEFAQILGITLQAVRLWVRDDRKVSLTITRLIALFEKYPQLLREFR